MSKKLLGDLTAEKMRELRLDRVANQFTRLTGIPCNCDKRKEQLNTLHRKIIKR